MTNIRLNDSIDNTLINIDNNIHNISEILTNIYNAIMSLDETKWNTKEKKKIDEQLVPYVKMLSISYPKYLNKRLEFTKQAIQKYRDLNIKQQKNTELLEDFS